MKYAIVFSSRTGNTAQLAKTLQNILPQEDCIYFGEPDEKALTAPMIFAGFWTDKGFCDETTKCFLKTLKNRQVFLFGTAGFGGSLAYFEKILDVIKKNLDVSVQLTGSFMCQGKMPASVLERYEKMLINADNPAHIHEMIDNFHKAASHPDQSDIEALKLAVTHLKQTGGNTL